MGIYSGTICMGGGTLLNKPILCPYVFVLVYFAIVSPTKMLVELEFGRHGTFITVYTI